MNQFSMDVQSTIYQAISNTFPAVKKWNQHQKNNFSELIRQYLFEHKNWVMEEIIQCSNKATSILISGYEISVKKNKFGTIEELEKHLTKIQETQLQKLLAQMNLPKAKESSIEKLKKKLPSHCIVINLNNCKGNGLSGFRKWMKIFYPEKKRS